MIMKNDKLIANTCNNYFAKTKNYKKTLQKL